MTLWTIDQAAAELNVGKGTIKTVLAEHPQFKIKMGREIRVNPDDLGEIIDACREKPKVPASTSDLPATAEQSNTSSSIPVASSVARAQRTSDKLKRLSSGTSKKSEGAPVVQLRRQK